jgi:hypothetical protein
MRRRRAIEIGRVFEFPHMDEDGIGIMMRVLARDSAEAFAIFDSYREDENEGRESRYKTRTFGSYR